MPASDSDPEVDLGELQKRLLVVIGEATDAVAAREDRRAGFVQHGDLKDRLREKHPGYHVRSASTLKTSVSRALHGLCDRGLVIGLATEWVEYHGEHGDMPRLQRHGKTPFDDSDHAPTLQYLGLTDAGRSLASDVSGTVTADHSPAGMDRG